METIEMVKEKILPILSKYGVRRAGLFGSVVRKDFGQSSDVDILVDVDDHLSLLSLIEMKLALQDVLERPVDLVEYEMIKPQLRPYILDEEIRIL